MDTMGIAASSIDLSQFRVQQQVQTSVLKDAMETQEMAAAQLLQGFQEAVPPSASIIDVMA